MSDREKSPSDFESSCLATMPGQVGGVFYQLWQSAVFLQAIRELLGDLFGDEETVELLNYTASFVFIAVRECMQREYLITLARFTDPAASGGDRSNISVNRLLHEIETSGDQAFAATIRPLVESISTQSAPVRSIRNKVLAHTDLAVAFGTAPTSLPSVKRRDLEGLTDEILDLLLEVELHYRGSQTVYKQSVAYAEAEALLRALRCSRDADLELRRQ